MKYLFCVDMCSDVGSLSTHCEMKAILTELSQHGQVMS